MTHRPEPSAPEEKRSPLPLIILTVASAILLGFLLTRWLGAEEDGTAPTAPARETTVTTSTAPTTAPPTTDPAQPSTTGTATTPPTTIAPTTTDTSFEASDLPERAVAQTGGDIVWVDPVTGETEIAHPAVFEAAWAENMALSPDQSRLYYQRMTEDFWFACEAAQGEVVVLDVDSGAISSIARGRPALSPTGERLAYLTAEECYPDPDEPEFFLTAYDTLVIGDPEGNELARLPAGEGDPLTHLVWEDDETLLVTDGSGNHFRVPADTSEGTIRDQERLELPALVLYAVVEGRALGAEHTPNRLPGPLMAVDLDTGDTTPIETDTLGPYPVGVSSDGDILVGARRNQGEHVLLVDVDLETGRVAGVVDSPPLSVLDWEAAGP